MLMRWAILASMKPTKTPPASGRPAKRKKRARVTGGKRLHITLPQAIYSKVLRSAMRRGLSRSAVVNGILVCHYQGGKTAL